LDSHENILFGISLPNYLLGLTPDLQLLSGLIASPPSVDLAAGPSGNLFLIDESNRIKQLVDGQYVSLFNADLSAVLGVLPVVIPPMENNPMSIAADAKGNVYVSDQFLGRIRLLPAGSCSVTPGPAITSIVDSGSYNVQSNPESFAPGELITIKGTGLGPATGIGPILDSDGLIPKNLSGVTVLFNGIAGPVFYASATQINAIIPFTSYGVTSVNVQVIYNGLTSDAAPISMASSSPQIFSTIAAGFNNTPIVTNIVVNQDGSVNSQTNPAHASQYITCYATGMGRTNAEGIDGHPAIPPLPLPQLPVSVDFGTLLYAGDAYGLVEGAMQINIQLPSTVPSTGGEQQLIHLKAGSASTVIGFWFQ